MDKEPTICYRVNYCSKQNGWRTILSTYKTLETARDVARQINEVYGDATQVIKISYTAEVVEQYDKATNQTRSIFSCTLGLPA